VVRVIVAAAILMGLVTACGSSGQTSAPSASTEATSPAAATISPSTSLTPSTAPSSSAPGAATPAPSTPFCPNQEGGLCLGPIEAGTYTTVRLQPRLTYTVPAGWANLEDTVGNFLLLPPGSTLEGVNPGTSDYLGVYSWVVASELCTDHASGSIPPTFDGLVGWLKSRPAIEITHLENVEVSGLQGVSMDIAMATPKGDGCADGIWADIYVGKFPSDLTHSVTTDYPIRIYLLRNGEQTLAIEEADAKGGSDYKDWWTAADKVVKTFVIEPI
jgi:hypothetical protein